MMRLLACSLLVLCAPLGCGNHAMVEGTDLSAPLDMAAPAQAPVCVDGADAGLPPVFSTVQRIFNENCLGSGCHDADPFSPFVMMDLRSGHSYVNTVKVAAVEVCDGGAAQTRIIPGDAGASYLYQKLTLAQPCSGNQMPQGETPYVLPDCELAILRQWIEAGASMN